MILIYILVLILSGVCLADQVFRRRQPEAQLLSSISFQMCILSFSRVLKTIEASLLNIFLTNYILVGELSPKKPWDVYGLLMIALVNLILSLSAYQ